MEPCVILGKDKTYCQERKNALIFGSADRVFFKNLEMGTGSFLVVDPDGSLRAGSCAVLEKKGYYTQTVRAKDAGVSEPETIHKFFAQHCALFIEGQGDMQQTLSGILNSLEEQISKMSEVLVPYKASFPYMSGMLIINGFSEQENFYTYASCIRQARSLGIHTLAEAESVSGVRNKLGGLDLMSCFDIFASYKTDDEETNLLFTSAGVKEKPAELGENEIIILNARGEKSGIEVCSAL